MRAVCQAVRSGSRRPARPMDRWPRDSHSFELRHYARRKSGSPSRGHATIRRALSVRIGVRGPSVAPSVTGAPGPSLPRHQLPEPIPTYLAALQVERGVSRHTLLAYRRDLADFVAFLGRRRGLRAVTADDVVAFLGTLRGRGLRASSIVR